MGIEIKDSRLFREEVLHERKERLQDPRASFGVYVMTWGNYGHHIRKSLRLQRPKYRFTPGTNFHSRRENEDNVVRYFTGIQSGIEVPVS